MLILSPDNYTYNTDLASTDSKTNIHYCSLDLNTKDADFYFYPLVFLESFNSSAVVLKIGKFKIALPYDWFILIGDKNVGDMEIIAIEDLNNRDLSTPVMNPLSSFLPSYEPIQICDTYSEVRWFFPKLNANNLLAIPLREGHNPPCAFFVNEVSGRKLDTIKADIFYGGVA